MNPLSLVIALALAMSAGSTLALPSTATAALSERSDSSAWFPLSSHGLLLTKPIVHVPGVPHLPVVYPSGLFDGASSLFEPEALLVGDGHEWDEDLRDWLVKRQPVTGRRAANVTVLRRRGSVEPEVMAVVEKPHAAMEKRGRRSKGRTEQKVRGVAAAGKAARKQLVEIGKTVVNAAGNVMKGATILTTITWYTGQDLKNPACGRKSHWTPTDSSLIVAVTEIWEQRPACGEFMEIALRKNPQKNVIVRVLDLCAGCKPHKPHADLTKAAFTKLFDLDVGVASDLLMRKVPAPQTWNNQLYGPKIL